MIIFLMKFSLVKFHNFSFHFNFFYCIWYQLNQMIQNNIGFIQYKWFSLSNVPNDGQKKTTTIEQYSSLQSMMMQMQIILTIECTYFIKSIYFVVLYNTILGSVSNVLRKRYKQRRALKLLRVKYGIETTIPSKIYQVKKPTQRNKAAK